MATIRNKSLATFFLSAASVVGITKDRMFNEDNGFTVEDFTEAEAIALLDSTRGEDFERVGVSLFALPKEQLQARYAELSGKEADKRFTEAKLIAAIEDLTAEKSAQEEADRLAQEQAVKLAMESDEQDESTKEDQRVVNVEEVSTPAVIATVDAEHPTIIE